MHLRNTGWAYAVHDGKSGVIPLNYIVINKNTSPSIVNDKILVSRTSSMKESNGTGPTKAHSKRVSFGDIEIFENDDSSIRKEKIPADSKPELQE